MAQHAPLRYWIAVFITQGLGSLAVYAGAVYFWSTSPVALIGFLAVMVLPIMFYAAMGAFVLDPTKTSDALIKKDAPAVERRLWLATSPIAACAVMYSAFLLSFHVDSTRLALVESSSKHGYYQIAERGLFDQAANVRMAACEAVGAHSAETSMDALAHAMQADDALADCAMRYVGAGANDIRLDLQAARWESELVEMQSNEQAERACLLARRLFHADRIGLSAAVPRLLTCATDSASDAARECCAQSLIASIGEASGVATLLPSPTAFAATSFVERLPGYIAASQRAPTNSFEIALGMNAAPMRAWTIRTTCAAIVNTQDVRDGLINSLADATESETCTGPDVNALSLVAWENACAALKPETPDADTPFVVCDAANQNLIAITKMSAQRGVSRALHAANEPERDVRLTNAILTYIKAKAKDPDISALEKSDPNSNAQKTIDMFRSGDLSGKSFNSGNIQDVTYLLQQVSNPQIQSARQLNQTD